MSDQSNPKPDSEKLFSASEEIRRFEINLLWQRAAYFWGFIVVIFGGYAALKTVEDGDPILDTLVACFGFVCAVGWTLANRGSKFWFHVWENKAEQAASEMFTTQVWKDFLGKDASPRKSEFYSVSDDLKQKIKSDDRL